MQNATCARISPTRLRRFRFATEIIRSGGEKEMRQNRIPRPYIHADYMIRSCALKGASEEASTRIADVAIPREEFRFTAA